MSSGRFLLAMSLFASLSGSGTPAAAACVQCSCSIESSGLAFGAYFARLTTDSVATVGVNCEGDNGYVIKLSAGSSGNSLQRTLRSGQNVLVYNVFKDPGRSLIWGDGSAGQTGMSGSGTGTYSVYGEIFANQAQPVGRYGDMLVLTIEY